MAAVDILSVKVNNNPAPFLSALSFEIAYEVRESLADDIEWRVVYVGSAESEAHDQELDAVWLPANQLGRFAFVLEVPAPQPERVPPTDAVGVTIVLLTCRYRGREFLRVGYYVNNEYPPEVLAEESARVRQRLLQSGATEEEAEAQAAATVDIQPPRWDRITRHILAEEPRVTRFPCAFDRPAGNKGGVANGADAALTTPAAS
ncbi:hypothetical protein CDCA_CDCA13G3609 [Cyanidium caldarium]|uniref:Anti-silencing function protein 1 n=1 Tax=Cyanidium caldarium TaxID=2771 RepID=A0AAV9IZ91_CYACA|nr:hypothetical protein CDCA_CDCA13G3609 [Cyanidium caldarium]